MAMYPDEYAYDHEDRPVLQMSYHNKNIYAVFSRQEILLNQSKRNFNKPSYVSFDDNINSNLL
jgi:hypothetical protein